MTDKVDAGTAGSIEALLQQLKSEALMWEDPAHPRTGMAPLSRLLPLIDELAALLTRRDHPQDADELEVLVEELTDWWHLNREGSVNRSYDYIDKMTKKLREALTRRDAPQEIETLIRKMNLGGANRSSHEAAVRTVLTEYFNDLGRDADPAKEPDWQPIEHGRTCVKAKHLGDGYLHGENDDRPYDVDGVLYCGRCHSALTVAAKEPE